MKENMYEVYHREKVYRKSIFSKDERLVRKHINSSQREINGMCGQIDT